MTTESAMLDLFISLRDRQALGLSDRHGCRYPKRTVRQVRREVRAMNNAAKQINKSAASARTFLQKNGFITKQHKVSAHYR